MKLLIPLLFLLLSFQFAFAQFHYGVKGGASLAYMALEQLGVSNEQPRVSFQAGLYAKQHISQRFFSKVELLYASKGFKAEAPSIVVGGLPETFTTHLHYLSLPALIGYSPVEDFFVVVGPEISCLLMARSRFGSESNDASALWNEWLDFGITAGIGYKINKNIGVELRYVYGLRDVATFNYNWANPNDPLIDMIKSQSRNRVFQLSLAYQFD